jgi:hypothetical protein
MSVYLPDEWDGVTAFLSSQATYDLVRVDIEGHTVVCARSWKFYRLYILIGSTFLAVWLYPVIAPTPGASPGVLVVCVCMATLGAWILVYPFVSSRSVIVDLREHTLTLQRSCFGDRSRTIPLSRIKAARCRELVRRRSREYPARSDNLQRIHAVEVTTTENDTIRLFETTAWDKVEIVFAAITKAIAADEAVAGSEASDTAEMDSA